MAAPRSLRITLPASLHKLVETRVRNGEFASADELISHSLRLFADESRRLAAESNLLCRKIAEGIRQAERGELVDAQLAFKQLVNARRLRRSSSKSNRARSRENHRRSIDG